MQESSLSSLPQPEISILMSVYNGGIFLAPALESMLGQTFSDFECILIDDASTDSTSQVLADFAARDSRVQVIKNSTNLGLTASLNKGLAFSKGRYIARMDADDIALPGRFMTQYWFMEEHPDVAACGSWISVIDEQGQLLGEKNLALSYEDIKKKMLFNNQFIHSTLFFRADILKENGGYNEFFKKSQDYELMLRLSSKYPVVNLREKLLQFRLYKSSLSWMNSDQQKYAIKARWLAIRKYHFPFFRGLVQICFRFLWLVVPKKLKMLYNKKKTQDLLQQV